MNQMQCITPRLLSVCRIILNCPCFVLSMNFMTLLMICFLHEFNHSLTICSFLDKLRKEKRRKGKDVQLKPLKMNSLTMFPKKVTSDTKPKVR